MHDTANINNDKSLGARLKLARLKNNFSQKYVCSLLGVKQSTFSSWERDVAEPNHIMLLELCRLYKIDNIMDFFTADNIENFFEDNKKEKNTFDIRFETEIKIESVLEKNFIEDFRMLDERGKSTVMNCLRSELEYLRKNLDTRVIKPLRNYKFTMREIPVYTQPAAAGFGNYLDDGDFEIMRMEVPINADVGIRISGTSMEPVIKNNSIVWVKQCETLEYGETGIFILNGNAYCKILKKDIDGIYLKSENPEYADIRILPSDHLQVYGKVLS